MNEITLIFLFLNNYHFVLCLGNQIFLESTDKMEKTSLIHLLSVCTRIMNFKKLL